MLRKIVCAIAVVMCFACTCYGHGWDSNRVSRAVDVNIDGRTDGKILEWDETTKQYIHVTQTSPGGGWTQTVDGSYLSGDGSVSGTLTVGEHLTVDGNIRATKYYGDGSNLTGITATEIDTLQTVTTRGNTTTEDLTLQGNVSILGVLSVSNALYAEQNGNIGIGNSSPTAKLYVNGNTTISGSLSVNDQVLAKIFSKGLNEPTGIENASEFTMSYKAHSRNLSSSGAFWYWLDGTRYESPQINVTHADSNDLYYLYYDSTNTLQYSTTSYNIKTDVPISFTYYEATNKAGASFDERHGCQMDNETHNELHNTIGAYWNQKNGGLALSGYTIQPVSPADANNQWSLSSSTFYDEDIAHTIPENLSTSNYLVAYRNGASGIWTWETNALPFDTSGTYIYYNQLTGGSWQETALVNNEYVNYYIIHMGSLSTTFRTVVIMGQAVHQSLLDARSETINSITWGGFPNSEIISSYKITFRTSSAYTSTGKCRIAYVTDTRATTGVQIVSGSTVNDHGTQSGLADDDHTQYALVAATRTPDFTGQVDIGNALSINNSLTVSSGGVIIAGGNVGIGTTNATHQLKISDGTVNSFVSNSSNQFNIGTLTNHDVNFYTNSNSSVLLLQNDGNVGIGTSVPDNFIVAKSSISAEPQLVLNNTNTDAQPPGLTFRKTQTGSAADDDYIGRIKFDGLDSGDTNTNYARFDVISKTVADGNESGQIDFYVMDDDGTPALTRFLKVDGEIGTNAIIFNEDSNDLDFRVESDTFTKALFVEGSSGDVIMESDLSVEGDITTQGLYVVDDEIFAGDLKVLADVTVTYSFTIPSPDGLDASGGLPLPMQLDGNDFVITAIYCQSDDDDVNFSLKKMTQYTDFTNAVDAGNFTIATDGTGIYTDLSLSPALSVMEYLSQPVFVPDGSDTPDYITVSMGGYLRKKQP